MNKVKAILFDMDGVLVDSMSAHIESWYKAFHKFNIKVSKDELRNLGGVNFKDTIQILSEKYNVKLSTDDQFNLYHHKIEVFKKIHKVIIYSNVVSNIKLLREKGFKIALVTGSYRELTDEIVEGHFNELFDVIVTSDDTYLGKPNPDPYLKARDDLKLKSEQCIIVEDSIMGLTAAKAANIFGIGITTTMNKEFLEEIANKVVSNHEELFEYLSSL